MFSNLDADRGIWQGEVRDVVRDKIACTSNIVLYQLSSMPFKRCSAFGIFRRTVNVILSPGKRQFALMYLDDYIIILRIAYKHIKHVPREFCCGTMPGDVATEEMQVLYGERRLFRTCNTPWSFGTRFAYNGRYRRFKPTQTGTDLKSFLCVYAMHTNASCLSLHS